MTEPPNTANFKAETLHKQLIGTQLMNKFPAFMKPESQLPCSQKPTTESFSTSNVIRQTVSMKSSWVISS
jgi:hypothetical protein